MSRRSSAAHRSLTYLSWLSIILSGQLLALFLSTLNNLSSSCFLPVYQSDAVPCTSLKWLLLLCRCMWLRHRLTSQLPSVSFELTPCEGKWKCSWAIATGSLWTALHAQWELWIRRASLHRGDAKRRLFRYTYPRTKHLEKAPLSHKKRCQSNTWSREQSATVQGTKLSLELNGNAALMFYSQTKEQLSTTESTVSE